MVLDISKIEEKIPFDKVEKITVYKDSDINVKGLDELKNQGAGKFELITR